MLQHTAVQEEESGFINVQIAVIQKLYLIPSRKRPKAQQQVQGLLHGAAAVLPGLPAVHTAAAAALGEAEAPVAEVPEAVGKN